jgi:hypothetical protein
MVQLLGCQPFPVFRITRVAFGRLFGACQTASPLRRTVSQPGRGMSAGTMVKVSVSDMGAIKAQAGSAGKSSYRLGLEQPGPPRMSGVDGGYPVISKYASGRFRIRRCRPRCAAWAMSLNTRDSRNGYCRMR